MADEITHEFAGRLSRLRTARESFLTDDEYARGRASVLDELTTFPRLPLRVHAMFLGFCVMAVAIMVLIDSGAGWFAGLVLFHVSLFFWWSMSRDFARKRRLTRSERLDAIVELGRNGLVSFEEADALRERIDRSFAGHLER